MIEQLVNFKQDLHHFVPEGQQWTIRLWLKVLLEQRVTALFIYRFGRWVCFDSGGGLLFWPLKILYILADKLIVQLLLGMSIPASCSIGPGLYINNFQGLVINGRAKLGKQCSLGHGVIIGAAGNGVVGAPVLGDNVFVGSRAIVIGPITVGDNVRVGACAVVNRDVPANVTVAGVPAKIVKCSQNSGSAQV